MDEEAVLDRDAPGAIPVRAQTLYEYHLRVLPLGPRPFEPAQTLREPFAAFFADEECFTQRKDWILEDASYAIPPGGLYFRGLGALTLVDPEADQFDEATAGSNSWWNQLRRPILTPGLGDERYNLTSLRLHRPVRVLGIHEGKTRVHGRIFLHLYPSGYLTVGVALSCHDARYLADAKLVRATRGALEPWRTAPGWTFRSRLGTLTLPQQVDAAILRALGSMFKEPANIPRREWYSVYRVVPEKAHDFDADEKVEPFPEILGFGEGKEFVPTNRNHAGEVFFLSKRRLLYVAVPRHDRHSAVRLTHRVASHVEAIALRESIVRAYSEYVETAVPSLKEGRLRPTRFALREMLSKHPYDYRMGRFLLALDVQRRQATPFFRRIEFEVADTIELKRRRKNLDKAIALWETEIAERNQRVQGYWRSLWDALVRFGKSLFGLK